MAEPMTLAEAEELDAKARAQGHPTPRAAMAVLLAHDATLLADAEHTVALAYDRIRARALRANHVLDDQGRGLPMRHPDRLSLNDLVALTDRHRTTINHWMEDLTMGPMVKRAGRQVRDTARARPDLIPTYDLTGQNPVPGAPA